MFCAGARPSFGCVSAERGAASVEWAALTLLVSLTLGAAVAVAPPIDGRSFAGFLAHRISCSVSDDCKGEDADLVAIYGESDAALLRRHAPNITYEPGERSLPVDWRDCRVRACSRASDRAGLDVHRSDAGEPATVFTHVVRRDGEIFLQYWMYYPYSSTTIGNAREGIGSTRISLAELKGAVGTISGAGISAGPASGLLPGKLPKPQLTPWSVVDQAIRKANDAEQDPAPRLAQLPKLWQQLPLPVRAVAWNLTDGRKAYPGFHYDDWEGYQVRIDLSGRTTARSTSHGGYQTCRSNNIPCRGRFGEGSGWTRVSYGSHAGHFPGASPIRSAPFRPRAPLPGERERSTTAAGLRLVPLERIDRSAYTRRDERIVPPWEKEVYDNPLSGRS